MQGALATAGKYSLNSWAVAKRGPAYPPMFNPLSVIFTVVFDSILMGDDLTVGRLVAFFGVYDACSVLPIKMDYASSCAKCFPMPKTN